jgi:hypothetical protein
MGVQRKWPSTLQTGLFAESDTDADSRPHLIATWFRFAMDAGAVSKALTLQEHPSEKPILQA